MTYKTCSTDNNNHAPALGNGTLGPWVWGWQPPKLAALVSARRQCHEAALNGEAASCTTPRACSKGCCSHNRLANMQKSLRTAC